MKKISRPLSTTLWQNGIQTETYPKCIWKNGILITGYTEMKILGIKTATVFARINTEYNYAKRNNYILYDNSFVYDEEEIAVSIGFEVSDVQESIKTLENLNLIETKVDNSINVMNMKLENIIDFIKKAERENDYKPWDYALNKIQSKGFNGFKFTYQDKLKEEEERKKMMEEWKKGEELARDENGNLLRF